MNMTRTISHWAVSVVVTGKPLIFGKAKTPIPQIKDDFFIINDGVSVKGIKLSQIESFSIEPVYSDSDPDTANTR